jgi:hypothetical protein
VGINEAQTYRQKREKRKPWINMNRQKYFEKRR